MRAFLQTSAGKGTVGVCLTVLILVWPVVGTWLVASLTLAFSVHHLSESFRQIDAQADAPPSPIDPPDTATALAELARGEDRRCDVNAVMAALTAQASRAIREI